MIIEAIIEITIETDQIHKIGSQFRDIIKLRVQMQSRLTNQINIGRTILIHGPMLSTIPARTNGIQITKITKVIKGEIHHITLFNPGINHQVDITLEIKCRSKIIRITDQIRDRVITIKARIISGTLRDNLVQILSRCQNSAEHKVKTAHRAPTHGRQTRLR